MNKRILIVDDCTVNVEILHELLRDDYDLATAESGEDCLKKLRHFSPDLVLLDIMMPGLDGYEVCRRIKASPSGDFTQVILVSGKASARERVQGYQAGADDYIVKPFDHDELLAKVRLQFRLRETLEELWSANARIQQFNAQLEEQVHQRTAEVVATRDMAIFGLAKLAESRDPDAGEHLERMRQYSRILAEQLGREGPYVAQIDQAFIDDIYRSSPLHDIGKVGIPDAILLKPGRLTRDEFEIMKQHTTIGAEALRQAVEESACGSFLDMAIDIARHHHERYLGTGYPDGLAGDEIPLSARIVALADVYDALTSDRVYKSAFDPEVAKSMIEEEKGQHFDPDVVEAFRARYDDFLQVVASWRAPETELVEAAASGDLRR
ncbi:MAG: response regulator [Pirellulales bacterium]|nr:response regulator [Pirellulales bacterium]